MNKWPPQKEQKLRSEWLHAPDTGQHPARSRLAQSSFKKAWILGLLPKFTELDNYPATKDFTLFPEKTKGGLPSRIPQARVTGKAHSTKRRMVSLLGYQVPGPIHNRLQSPNYQAYPHQTGLGSFLEDLTSPRETS